MHDLSDCKEKQMKRLMKICNEIRGFLVHEL
jgi:hypothetical protein